MLKHIFLLTLGFIFSINTGFADSWLTWSELSENRQNIQVYLSRESDGKMDSITQLSQSGMNITPTILATHNSLWVVWVDRGQPAQYYLRYVRVNPTNHQILESGQIKTADLKVYAPVIEQNTQGIPVLAWSGLGEQDEEIRLSFYRNGHWQPEISLSDNDLPDSLPVFEKATDGSLLLNWEQITRQGIITLEYSLPEELTAPLRQSTEISPANAKTKAGRNYMQRKTNLDALPPALNARQDRFYMGSREEVQQ